MTKAMTMTKNDLDWGFFKGPATYYAWLDPLQEVLYIGKHSKDELNPSWGFFLDVDLMMRVYWNDASSWYIIKIFGKKTSPYLKEVTKEEAMDAIYNHDLSVIRNKYFKEMYDEIGS